MLVVSSTTSLPSTCATRGGGLFDPAILEKKDGFVSLRLEGPGVADLVKTEPGGHRWQQASGKRGQIHTSTVTVAVLAEPKAHEVKIDFAREVQESFFSGTGAGGQARNRSENCVRLLHKPTGIEAKSEGERSMKQNIAYARALLAARVAQHYRAKVESQQASARRQQVGSGQRGDKIRTIRCQDGIVTCERTGKKTRLKDYLRGDLDWLS